MNSDGAVSNEVFQWIEKIHETAVDEANELEHILSNIRFEGKSSLGRNLKRLRLTLGFFWEELLKHLEIEDCIIFPFLKSRLPKLEPIIHLLEAEHEDFRRNLNTFQFYLAALRKEKNGLDRAKLIERVGETGAYLAYLLRHHIHAENQLVYESLGCDLRPEEEKELLGLIRSTVSDGEKVKNRNYTRC